MSTVTVDLIKDSALSWNSQGFQQTRVFRVEGVGAGDPSMRHYLAMSASGIPRRLEQHPTLGIARFRVKEISVAPEGGNSADAMRVTVRYDNYVSSSGSADQDVGDPAQIETFGTLEQTVTNQDKDGKLLRIPVTIGEVTKDTTPEVHYMAPRFGLRITRRESRSPESVSNDAATYVGAVNISTFKGRPARTWLCGPIVARSDDGDATSIVTYELFYNPDTWDAEAWGLSWVTNQRVDGTKTMFPVSRERDLNGLGI
jgi:hypothetical protein